MAEDVLDFQALSERFTNVRKRIESAAIRCNRSSDQITLIAISKAHPVEVIRAGLALGIKDLGENRVQEAEGKEEVPVLIQIDLGGEETKTGIDPRQLPRLLVALNDCQHLRLLGLMTLPPYFENPDCARPYFKTLRELRDELQLQGCFGESVGDLSMGMSHDFEIAIEEGATMVRVGTAIFGERKKSPGEASE